MSVYKNANRSQTKIVLLALNEIALKFVGNCLVALLSLFLESIHNNGRNGNWWVI